MTRWDPDQYLRFERERTLPTLDLLARVPTSAPRRIADLGCGSGTSTRPLHARWPDAHVVGIDSSEPMIAAARRTDPSVEWVVDDLRSWRAAEPFDLVFSNAALQWVPDHDELFPRLLGQVAAGGTLAVQMPVNFESGAHRTIRQVADAPRWKPRWDPGAPTPSVGSPESYYRLLAPLAASVALWETEYLHIVPDAGAILEWVKGTTLRPFLSALPEPAEQAEFLAEILRGLETAYPPQPDGRVLFPFRRLFLVATRGSPSTDRGSPLA